MDYNVFSREADMMPELPSEHHFQAYSSSSMHYDYDNQDFEDRIDPSLQDSNYACHRRDLRAANMQRFFQEYPASWLETQSYPIPSSTYDSPYGYPSVVSSIAPGAQYRHDSPISYQQSLATSDNDPYVDSTQGPSTPPNNAILSPHIAPRDSHSPRLVLTGLADPGAGSDSSTSTPFYDNNPNPFASLNTPTFGVNTKIQTFTTYPELQDADTEDAQVDEGSISDLSSPANRDDDDDEDYKPTPRAKSSRAPKTTPKTTPRHGRPRRPSSGTNASKANSKAKVSKPSPSSRAAAARKLASSTAVHTKMCPHCPHGFTDQATLQKHINSLHKRPFTCVFHFAGCDKVFANKNEWKRHAWAQHLNLHYWLCTNGPCGHASNQEGGNYSKVPTHGRIFRRKDLFTQHIRRMHAPAHVVKAEKDKNLPPAWVAQEKEMQNRAIRQRCELPTFMRCPAENCHLEFSNGTKTWDNRMEHVAVHLERAASNEEPAVLFGGGNDAALTDWASSQNVKVIEWATGGWKTCQPLKATRVELCEAPSIDTILDVDAEGEECL
ncbi:hypothetical protein CEP51_012758 [Fusarium floridanum]|uniref:C2H2-type domain-containing protein n=1 Tax=Fusarium floridanum TaxID=1325733 RepID=A0A428QNH3_9HYPO|nr:hypothetical protein CEP51_012758 [Fusarium floridanum]